MKLAFSLPLLLLCAPCRVNANEEDPFLNALTNTDEYIPEDGPVKGVRSDHCNTEGVLDRCGDEVVGFWTVNSISTAAGCNDVEGIYYWGCCMKDEVEKRGVNTVPFLFEFAVCFATNFWNCIITNNGEETCPSILPDDDDEEVEPTTSPPQPTTPPPQPTPAPVSPIPTPDDDKDDDDGGTAGPCLSHANTVHVLGKGRVSIADVQVGDLVLTAGASGKDEHYESVYALGHYDTKSKGQYIQFHFAGDSLPLEVTAEHLVFLKGNINPVRADSVKVGDIVQGTGLDANEFDFRVKKIRTLKRNGLYNPLTPSGTLIVNDGVVASTYISLSKSVDYFGGAMGVMSHQTYVHWMLAPFRLLCMGVSPSICNASLDEHGIPHYISFGMALHKLVQKQNSFVQMIFFGIVTMLCGICLLIETVFGASVGPITFLFLTITGVIVWKMAKNGYRGNTKLKTA